MPAAWDVVEPRVAHNTCAALEEWVRSNCLITFLDGTGEPFFSSDPLLRRCGWRAAVLDFTDVFAPSTAEEVFPLVSNKPFPELRYTLGFRRFPVLRVKNPLVLMSGNEYFVSTAQRGRAHRVGQWCVLRNQYWDAVKNHSESNVSEWSLWSG